MQNVPAPVAAYVLSFMLEQLSLAYLLVSKDGCLLAWGGKLAAYGVTNLQKETNAGEQIFFLEGLLPLDGFPLFLPRIKTQYGICADMHIFPTEEGDWVLLLDATKDEIQLSLIQQQVNDSSLLQEKSLEIFNQ